MKRNCKHCGVEIPSGRLEILPFTQTCVKCSTEAPKAGRLVTYGQGEEIHTELEILDRDTYRKIRMAEKNYPGVLLDNPEFLDNEPDYTEETVQPKLDLE
jgi:hypothetical protein